MKDHQVTHVDPAVLRVHPKVKHLLGRWSKDSESASALRRSIQERGIIQPLIVTPDHLVMDGVMRLEATRLLQLQTVPCLERPETEALEICIETELNRRHGTKSQLAFRFAPLIADAFTTRSGSQFQNLRKGSAPGLPVAKSLEHYAVELGVSVRLLEKANELHELFTEFEKDVWSWSEEGLEQIGRGRNDELTFREYFTAHLLREEEPMSLGGALAGLKQKLSQEGFANRGRKHGGGKPVETTKQLRLFSDVFKTLETRYEYWTEFDAEQRDEAVARVAVSVQKAPTDFLEKLLARIKTELGSRKDVK